MSHSWPFVIIRVKKNPQPPRPHGFLLSEAFFLRNAVEDFLLSFVSTKCRR